MNKAIVSYLLQFHLLVMMKWWKLISNIYISLFSLLNLSYLLMIEVEMTIWCSCLYRMCFMSHPTTTDTFPALMDSKVFETWIFEPWNKIMERKTAVGADHTDFMHYVLNLRPQKTPSAVWRVGSRRCDSPLQGSEEVWLRHESLVWTGFKHISQTTEWWVKLEHSSYPLKAAAAPSSAHCGATVCVWQLLWFHMKVQRERAKAWIINSR